MRKIWVIDWKSAKGIFEEHRIQSACYLYMNNYVRDDVKVDCAGVLQLDKVTGKPGEFEDVTQDVERNWTAFVYLSKYYYLKLGDKDPGKFYPHNGSKFASITEILGVLQKPALPQWAANSTVEFITQHLEDLKDEKKAEYILKKAKTAYRTIGKTAMDTGSLVHDAIHAHLSGNKPDEILKGNDAAENAFLAFLQWADEHKLEPIYLEEPIVVPEFKVGGTPDFIGYADI